MPLLFCLFPACTCDHCRPRDMKTKATMLRTAAQKDGHSLACEGGIEIQKAPCQVSKPRLTTRPVLRRAMHSQLFYMAC